MEIFVNLVFGLLIGLMILHLTILRNNKYLILAMHIIVFVGFIAFIANGLFNIYSAN